MCRLQVSNQNLHIHLNRSGDKKYSDECHIKILHLSKCPTEKDKYILQYYLKEDWYEGPWDFEESALKDFKEVFGEKFNEKEHEIVYETFPMTERELYFFMEGLSCAFGKIEEE